VMSPPAGAEPWRGSPPDIHVDPGGASGGFQKDLAIMEVLVNDSIDLVFMGAATASRCK
jgi:hypothetical protein